MKIYFTAAVSSVTDELRETYARIVSILERKGHTVISNHLDNKDGKVIKSQSESDALSVQKKMSKWKKQADLVLVEASTPSFGVGQEITEALTDNKQVVVLYRAGMKPHILMNQGQEALYFVEYSEANLDKVLDEYIEYAKDHSDTRFNFFISPQIGSYLDWVSRKRKLPRAVYLRRLIEEEMKSNREYNEGSDE